MPSVEVDGRFISTNSAEYTKLMQQRTEHQHNLELLSVLSHDTAVTYQTSVYFNQLELLKALVAFYGTMTYARQRLLRLITPTTTFDVRNTMIEFDYVSGQVRDRIMDRLLKDHTPDPLFQPYIEVNIPKMSLIAFRTIGITQLHPL